MSANSLRPEFILPEWLRFRFAADCLPIGMRFQNHYKYLKNIGFLRPDEIFFSPKGPYPQNVVEQSFDVWTEEAKEIVASYNQKPVPVNWHNQGYKSDLLERLRKQRNETGFTFEWCQTAKNYEQWKYYLALIDRGGINGEFRLSENEIFLRNMYREKLAKEEALLVSSGRIASACLGMRKSFEDAPAYMNIKGVEMESLISDILHKYDFIIEKRLCRNLKRAKSFVFTRELTDKFHMRFIFVLEFPSDLQSHLIICHKALTKTFFGSWVDLYPPEVNFSIRLQDSTLRFRHYEKSGEDEDQFEAALRANIELYKLEHEYIQEITEGWKPLLQKLP